MWYRFERRELRLEIRAEADVGSLVSHLPMDRMPIRVTDSDQITEFKSYGMRGQVPKLKKKEALVYGQEHTVRTNQVRYRQSMECTTLQKDQTIYKTLSNSRKILSKIPSFTVCFQKRHHKNTLTRGICRGIPSRTAAQKPILRHR